MARRDHKNGRPPGRAPLDRAFDALCDPYRRRVLLAVSDIEGHDADEFTTTAFAAAGMGEEDPDVLQARLFHSHLPRLAEQGYVEWDRERGEIGRGPAFDEVEPLLRLLVDHADELPAEFP